MTRMHLSAPRDESVHYERGSRRLSVLVGIATYNRPVMLEKLLVALANTLPVDPDLDVAILVADNEPIRSAGLKAARSMQQRGFPVPILGVVVPTRGISSARNALLEAAFVNDGWDFLLMLDDDQLPSDSLLAEILRVQSETRADVVGGAVETRFEDTPPAWAVKSRAYSRSSGYSTGLVPIIRNSGNVLLSRTVGRLFVEGVRFDEFFALSGGEDTDFFLRLRKAGCTFARAERAIAYEVYPPSRVTVAWVLRRAFRVGTTDMLIARRHGGLVTVFRETAKVPAALFVGLLQLAIFAGSPSGRVDALRRCARSLGKLNGVLGRRYLEYRNTTHGN